MNFHQWIYTVCEIISNRTRKEITDIYSTMDLTDCKLSFIDNMTPQEYVKNLNYL